MQYKGTQGINKLANALSIRMKQASRSPLLLELGTIGDDYSLQTDTFPISMPAADYTVCRSAAYGQENGEVFHTFYESAPEDHRHKLNIGKMMKSIMPGDRVLVAWVQNEPVVIDIILPATVLRGGD